MQRRIFVSAPLLWWPITMIRAQGLAGLSEFDASSALKGALEKGAATAIQLLGRPDGFLGNPQVRIPLPQSLQGAAQMLSAIGFRKQIDEVQVSMNRAAEAAVPQA